MMRRTLAISMYIHENPSFLLIPNLPVLDSLQGDSLRGPLGPNVRIRQVGGVG